MLNITLPNFRSLHLLEKNSMVYTRAHVRKLPPRPLRHETMDGLSMRQMLCIVLNDQMTVATPLLREDYCG